jgi:hypothetical protein
MDSHVPLTERELLLVISRKRSAFPSYFITLSDGSRSMRQSNKFTFYMACAEFFALSFSTGFIKWRFHFADLCLKAFRYKSTELGWVMTGLLRISVCNYVKG